MCTKNGLDERYVRDVKGAPQMENVGATHETSPDTKNLYSVVQVNHSMVVDFSAENKTILTSNDVSDFFKNIVYLCQRNGVGLADVKHELNIHNDRINDWRSGNATDRRKIAPMAERLKVTVEDLQNCEPLRSEVKRWDNKIKAINAENKESKKGAAATK